MTASVTRGPGQGPRRADTLWSTTAVLIAVTALAFAVIAAFAAGDDGSATLVSTTTTKDVELVEYSISPASIEVPAGTELVVVVTNKGTMPHDLKLEGTTGTDLLQPGDSQRVSLGVIDHSTQAWCTIPGHKELGMVMDIVATGSSSAVAAVSTGSEAGSGASAPATDATYAEISRHPTAMPDSPNYTRYADGKWFDPVTRTGPITINARFKVEEGVAEVLPGTTVDAWTFDGAIPGPMIRGMVGDTVDFFLENPADSMMPHNVDFHAVTGPGGGSVRLDTAPGAVSELRVKLLKPGVYVYHCAFPDIPTHISHGMYGLVVVEPEGGLPAVDHEYYVMQHEFYTDAGGSKSTTELENAGHLAFSGENGNLENPTFVVFNGRPAAVTGDRALGVYGDDPINVGDTARIFVGNIGPNLVSSFHVIGEMFDTVYVEGSFALQNHDVQTTLVPSGGAAAVELTFEVPGTYLMVDHSIFRVHKGAAGAIEVQGTDRPDVYAPVTYSEDVRGG